MAKKTNFTELLIVVVVSVLIIGVFVVLSMGNNENTAPKNYSNVVTITVDELNEKLENNESFFLLYGRNTCPNCVNLKPKINEVAVENDIEVYYLDTDENDTEKTSEIAKEFGISSVPYFIIVIDGEDKYGNALVGDQPTSKVSSYIDTNIKYLK